MHACTHARVHADMHMADMYAFITCMHARMHACNESHSLLGSHEPNNNIVFQRVVVHTKYIIDFVCLANVLKNEMGACMNKTCYECMLGCSWHNVSFP